MPAAGPCVAAPGPVFPAGIEGDNLYGSSRPHFLDTLDDHPIAGRKAGGDEPFVADGAIDRIIRCWTLPEPSTISAMGFPFAVPGDPLLGGKDCTIDHPFLDNGAHIHARQEGMLRVRKDDPEDE